MSQVNFPLDTTSLVLGLLFPGVGHIVWGWKREGVRIAIAFVVITYISGNIGGNLLSTFLNAIDVNQIFYSLVGLAYLPAFLLWIWQINDLRKIISGDKNRSVKK